MIKLNGPQPKIRGRGGKLEEDFDVLHAESELQLNNWFYEHVRSKVAVTNDLPFDVEVRWESTATNSAPQALIEIPRGKTADIDTFESHHLRFYKRDVSTTGGGQCVPLAWRPARRSTLMVRRTPSTQPNNQTTTGPRH